MRQFPVIDRIHNVCVFACVYVFVCVCVSACVYVYVCLRECMCVYVCACVCPPLRLVIINGVMWCDMDPI